MTESNGPTTAQTILVVDDEHAVRAWVTRILVKSGYRVLQADDGGAALQVLDHHRGEVDLVLTDVFMPHHGGRDLAVATRERHPGVKLIFMSGYTEDFGEGGGFGPGALFLQKPFEADQLLDTVRAELQRV